MKEMPVSARTASAKGCSYRVAEPGAAPSSAAASTTTGLRAIASSCRASDIARTRVMSTPPG